MTMETLNETSRTSSMEETLAKKQPAATIPDVSPPEETDSNTSSSDDDDLANGNVGVVQKKSKPNKDALKRKSKHHPMELSKSTTTAAARTTTVDNYWFEPAPPAPAPPPGAKHGKSGVFYGGHWVDMEDLDGTFYPKPGTASGDGNKSAAASRTSAACNHDCSACPRSRSRNAARHPTGAVDDNDGSMTESAENIYDVVIIGAGCIGGAVARQLSQFKLKVLWLEGADDVSQGATKGNSGIVHAGYDDKPGTNRAKYCWKGNQMFAQLDRELRFGYQKNGSLVLAINEADMEHLYELKRRGEINGVQHLRVIDDVEELRQMEPHLSDDVIGALHAREAGNVIPYEYAIALAENAVDNGVELCIRREVKAIEEMSKQGINDINKNDKLWKLTVRHWEPKDYVESQKNKKKHKLATTVDQKAKMTRASLLVVIFSAGLTLMWLFQTSDDWEWLTSKVKLAFATLLGVILGGTAVIVATIRCSVSLATSTGATTDGDRAKRHEDMKALVEKAGRAVGIGNDMAVSVADMLVGGSGSSRIQHGVTVGMETVKARFVVNCAGGASDEIARMIGDESFKIKPRIGDYILLNRNQGHLAKHTLFPCPDPKLGKGVLVQTTLWSNLILGPTARDTNEEEAKNMTRQEIQEYILSKCKALVPSFDPKETIHTFAGARAKSDRGDWIIEPSQVNPRMIHVAGIDSPGLAGSPAIALDVVRLLQSVGLETPRNENYNPIRAPIITPKQGVKGLKFGPAGKHDSDGQDEAKMAANVICKCEQVTELEVVRALRRSLPIDSSQAIRKRTRAGMGHCQGDPDNYNCEARVKAIIARETSASMEEVGGRPWPATSTLTQRWIDENEKAALESYMKK